MKAPFHSIFLSGTEPTVACSYHEANNVLQELAKDRLRKSNYSTGQTPVDIIKTGVFLDPRIFEDPEPNRKSRYQRYPDQPDEDEIPSFFDTAAETDYNNLQTEDTADLEQPPDTTLQRTQDAAPQTFEDTVRDTSIPQTHTEDDSENMPQQPPSPPPPESDNGTEQTNQDGIIQDDGINPWL